MPKCIHIYAHVCMCMYIHMCMCACVYMCMFAYVLCALCMCMHVYICACLCMLTCVCVHVYVHAWSKDNTGSPVLSHCLVGSADGVHVVRLAQKCLSPLSCLLNYPKFSWNSKCAETSISKPGMFSIDYMTPELTGVPGATGIHPLLLFKDCAKVYIKLTHSRTP